MHIPSATWINTYLKGHDGRDVFDEARDTEKHGSRVTVLLDGTIDLQKVGLSVYRLRLFAEIRTFSDMLRLCGSGTDDLGMNDLAGRE